MSDNVSEVGYLLELDVIKVMDGSHTLHQPALRGEYVHGEQALVWETVEISLGPTRQVT